MVRTQNENEMDGFKYTMQYYLNNYPLNVFCVEPFTEVSIILSTFNVPRLFDSGIFFIWASL